MTRMWIGFDRYVRRHWLDQMALLARELRDDATIYRTLVDWLTTDIAGAEARQKTAQLLMRTWWRVHVEHVGFRDDSLDLVTHVSADDRLLLHWGMLLVVYPIFRDTAAIVGRLLRLQGDLQLGQVSQRLATDWGSNPTLQFVVPRLMRSWRDWEVLQARDSKGRYTTSPLVRPSAANTQVLLLQALLQARGGEVRVDDLVAAPELFPFALTVSAGELRRSPSFQVEARGQDLVVWPVTSSTGF